MRRLTSAVIVALVLTADRGQLAQTTQTPVDRTYSEIVALLSAEAVERSQLMETASYLTDVYGPRLTGSSNLKAAGIFLVDRLKAWGIDNGRLEVWEPFGPGWVNDRFVALALKPEAFTLIGYTRAWTPGTNGPVTAEAVHITVENENDFAKYRGTLAGKFVLTAPARDVTARFTPLATRLSEQELAELERPEPVRPPPSGAAAQAVQVAQNRFAFRRALRQFLVVERVAALIDPGSGDQGTVFVSGDTSPPVPPHVVLAVEHYNRLVRLLAKKIPVTLQIDIQNRVLSDVTNSFNVISELGGTDKAREVVMVGAHLDSWHAGTGATDNAAGVAVMMEVMRILKATRVPLRRTVRLALWTGEEQFILGSTAYVREHFADRATMTLKPEHAELSACFNLDNGTGAIRGIYLQGNEAAAPLFRAWMEPFRSVGMTTLAIRDRSGLTDHLAFDQVGLPGFQFIQDPIEYGTRTNHTNMDVYDRLQPKDLIQNAAIVAAFVYQAANLETQLPRKTLPKPMGVP